MTYKNAKIILFASLIVAMILPFSIMEVDAKITERNEQNQERYNLDDIKSSFEKADPYITITDGNYVSFDESIAPSIMSELELEIVRDFLALQNDYVEKVTNNPNQHHSLDKELGSKFSELEEDVADSQRGYQLPIGNWILPQAFAWGSDVCGISFGERHLEYDKKTIKKYTKQSTAEKYLDRHDYHEVSIYATDPRTTLSENSSDYAVEVDAYDCDDGEFRDQIVLKYKSKKWNLVKQIMEPNPEIIDYDTPVWWWNYYTVVWHLNVGEINPRGGSW